MSPASIIVYFQCLTSRKKDTSVRLGQHLYNILNDVDPKTANEIINTDFDPFYNDERIPAFVMHLLK